METRQTTVIDKKAEVVQNRADMPVDYVGYPTAPVGAEYPRDPVILDRREDIGGTTTTKPAKQGFGAKLKGWFGGGKKKGHTTGAGATVVDEHIHTKTVTTTTTVDQGVQQSHHLHGPMVANPYAQPAHGQIFVPANTAVQANPETGALLPASSLNGPVILPTGPKVIPIATNYPAGQAGPQLIPPSGGFINNSGNPYLTQQSYGPAGIMQGQGAYTETHVHESGYDKKAAAKAEKEEIKREKKLEKEEKRLEKDQIKMEKQIEKDQIKMEKQLEKDQAKLAKDQQKLENTLAKDEQRLENNQAKLQGQMEKREAKLEDTLAKDQMRMQETMSKDYAAGQNIYAGQAAPLQAGAHGFKHVVQEETKQDAYTGQVLDHNVFHRDTRF